MEQEQIKELVTKADQLYADGQLELAHQTYEAVLAEEPSSAWAYNRIGAILAQKGDTHGAEGALRKALELDPKLPQAHSNLGNLYYAQGNYEGALTKYKEAVALHPDNPVFHENLHAAYKKLGNLSEAVNALKQAHKLNREGAKAEAKARFSEIRSTAKGKLGCLGTSLIATLLIVVAVSILF